jgi:mannose-6-phosphate isomerase
MRIFKLENTVQRYLWGSVDGLADTLGIANPERKPAAELWMGSHPAAPSLALTEKGRIRLDTLIAADPEGCLGARVASEYGATLPFLFKGLSAGAPLSIQTHPDRKTAMAGFERENLAGIPLSSPQRSYRDDNHKPEMTLALTRFEGLCGFRDPAAIAGNLALLPGAGQGVWTDIDSGDHECLRSLVARILGLSGEEKSGLLDSVGSSVAALLSDWKAGAEGPSGLAAHERDACSWVARLLELSPGDSGALMPLVLNHIVMRPGEAIFIGSGIMHAYLSGTALEIMANSDNVIRGGLTSKHIDLPELLAILRFVPVRPALEFPFPASTREETWPTHSPEFCLSRISLTREPTVEGLPSPAFEFSPDGPEIILCAEGRLRIAESGGSVELARGESAFLRADAGACRIEGAGRAFRARVPCLREIRRDSPQGESV